jgi:predicted RNase H-like nuclease (RuvC/YqgF family)
MLVGAFAGRAYGQTLADVAKKEEERRKKAPAPAKVYTNKDLSPTPTAAPAPAATAPAAKAADDKAGKDTTAKEQPKDQEYWSSHMKALQQQLDRDSTFADALQSKINALTTDFSARDDPAQRAVIERERQKSIAEQNRLKKAIEDDKKAIADLQEEARRAGVPPGWLR